MNIKLPFNRPYMTGNELRYIAQAHDAGRLAGDGAFTIKCHDWLKAQTNCAAALLTHSCTAALEMSALLANISEGDEVIMPSYTFVSTASAFVMRGATPVFVDIRADTLNLDEGLIGAAITNKTKAIVPVHYAGVACEMDAITEVAREHGLMTIEDAAQGVGSRYKGRALGSLGDLGCYSFHETKNIISGEGGALLVNRHDLVGQAEIIREKGTDRSQFFRGEVDKYTWRAIGSSYLPGELVAAFLFAQLEAADDITRRRIDLWHQYHNLLEPLEARGALRRPIIPSNCQHNGHMYYVLLPSDCDRGHVIAQLSKRNVHAVFHYVPLHSSPAGRQYCRVSGSMDNTNELSSALIRLPLWVGMQPSHVETVVSALEQILGSE